MGEASPEGRGEAEEWEKHPRCSPHRLWVLDILEDLSETSRHPWNNTPGTVLVLFLVAVTNNLRGDGVCFIYLFSGLVVKSEVHHDWKITASGT